MNTRPLDTHTLDDERRIEAYRIRLDVTAVNRLAFLTRDDARLSLRGPDGKIDATLVAIESTMRDRANLPPYIRELDMPPAHRNPDPWTYCTNGPVCRLCTTAYRVGLPDAHPTLRQRITTAIANTLNRIIDGPRRIR